MSDVSAHFFESCAAIREGTSEHNWTFMSFKSFSAGKSLENIKILV
jgi:hypothetical protein